MHEAVLLSLVIVPLDYLWMRLQWLDERKSAYFDCILNKHSPFVECQDSLHILLQTPHENTDSPLQCLFLFSVKLQKIHII